MLRGVWQCTVGVMGLVVLGCQPARQETAPEPVGFAWPGEQQGKDQARGAATTPPPPAQPAEPLRVGAGVSAPRKLSGGAPQYTEMARRARIQGVVILEVLVGRDGQVGEAKVLKGLPMGLDDEAVKAVREWTFEPATKDGEAVAVLTSVTVEFALP